MVIKLCQVALRAYRHRGHKSVLWGLPAGLLRVCWCVLCRLAAEEAQNRETHQSIRKWDALVAAAAQTLEDLAPATVVCKPVAGVDAMTEDADASGSLSAGRLLDDSCPVIWQGLPGGAAAKAAPPSGAEVGVRKQQPERLSEPAAPASGGKQPAAKRHKASSVSPDLGARGEMTFCI